MNGAPSPRFSLALLGRFKLTGSDGVINLASGKLAGLLAYLTCTAPRPQSREKLSALLWGSHFDGDAVNPSNIEACLGPCPMSAFGTELTPPRRRRMSAFKGEAVISLDQYLVSN
jgi:hypothetical protein